MIDYYKYITRNRMKPRGEPTCSNCLELILVLGKSAMEGHASNLVRVDILRHTDAQIHSVVYYQGHLIHI